MYQSLCCIALRTIKYDDRKSIVTAWSDRLGRVSLAVPAGAGREARRRRAIMMPLSVFEGVVDIKPGHTEVLNIKDVRPLFITNSTSTHPAKTVVALFLSEVLEKLLRTGAPDRALWTFLINSIASLDRMKRPAGVASFPIVFLMRLGQILGISPDWGAWQDGRVLDMRDGIFRSSAPVSSLTLDTRQATFAALLARLDYSNSERLRIPRDTRRAALETVLRYYSIHHTSLDYLNSLQVVYDIF